MAKRVAICFSGQMRSALEGQLYYKENLYSQHEVEIFAHTWDNHASSRLLMDRMPLMIDWQADFPLPTDIYRGYRVVNEKFPAYNTFSMYCSIFKANLLKIQYEIDHGFKYDVVIRTRFDYALNRKLDLDSVEPGKVYVPADRQDERHITCADMFAYGTSEVMDRYCSTWLNIPRLYDSGFPINGEELLSGNLQINGLTGDNMVYVDMNNPFPPGPYNGNWHSFLRDDFKEWNKLR